VQRFRGGPIDFVNRPTLGLRVITKKKKKNTNKKSNLAVKRILPYVIQATGKQEVHSPMERERERERKREKERKRERERRRGRTREMIERHHVR